MYELMIETTFCAAHQLRNYKGKCEELHGHNWRIQVYVQAERLNDIDIAMDFHDLKRYAKEVTDQLDHAFLNNVFPFTEINPSSENISRWIYDSMKKKIVEETVRLTAVTVWESDSASATYYED
ncbi:MAG: 6-carboxytetrahydropterin synthase QueD [Nitrospirota bacterium]|uniref:6-carboxy-5,6,7,8-tetrahydropterin synthase n=1 Tax=Candidatus Magnetominusculus xianensis TaxID=1748249 RepID=A0ABR5SCD1_9BACT|nr:6-carboxytetrahydropterin synthase QueD [Candidatus Magnetominusculus xianensis]KWT76831.1 6-pyruvoyl tetrahydrobiopterin synthase [Candidatus Magnetominusculus xianensis]MBF0402663.1 6-carboxytetrahydropterin synthase QueD [Nitrospirota bacterium]